MAITSARAKIAGVWYELTYNDTTRMYEAWITLTGTTYHETGGAYNVLAEASDDTGQTATADGSALKGLNLVLREKTPPTLTLISPAPGYVTVSRPTFSLSIWDGESGVDLDSVSATLDGEPMSVETGNGNDVTFTPKMDLADGPHTLFVSACDHDGNLGELTADYVVDTTPPVLLFPVPENRTVLDDARVTITGTASDAAAPPVAVTVSVNGVDVGDVSVGDGGVFSCVAALNVGWNTIVATATDMAGLVSVQEIRLLRLVTDRTQGDEDRLKTILAKSISEMTAEERKILRSGPRGGYCDLDVNRVNEAVEVVAAWVREKGYAVETTAFPTFSEGNALHGSEVSAYFQNVQALKDVFPLGDDAPEVLTDVCELGYVQANALEKILVLVDEVRPLLEKSLFVSGEISCGEV